MNVRLTQAPTKQKVCSVLFLLAASLSIAMILPEWMPWTSWQIALLVIAAWLPFLTVISTSFYQRDKWFALLFVVFVAQTGHFLEHVAQMIQLHLLGMPGSRANGIFGMLNLEWVHFLWNSWFLLMILLLLPAFRSNKWLLILCLVALWHEAEHIVIMHSYLHTHMQGSPGLLAKGGLIAGGLPIARPDLHFFYVLVEEILILLVYLSERAHLLRKSNGRAKQPEAGQDAIMGERS